MEKILIIGEDLVLEKEMCTWLVPDGYEVEVLRSYDYEHLKKKKFDLILSEIPEEGADIYYKDLINTFDCKIIAIVREEDVEELQECGDAGVRDYIFMPIRKKELLTKVKWLVQKQSCQVENYSGVLFSNQEYKVCINNKWIYLTRNEYRICKTLAKNSEQTFTKDHIYDFIYDLEKDTQIETITEYIYSIRKKCKEVAVNPIETIWGLGYHWNYEECSA